MARAAVSQGEQRPQDAPERKAYSVETYKLAVSAQPVKCLSHKTGRNPYEGSRLLAWGDQRSSRPLRGVLSPLAFGQDHPGF